MSADHNKLDKYGMLLLMCAGMPVYNTERLVLEI